MGNIEETMDGWFGKQDGSIFLQDTFLDVNSDDASDQLFRESFCSKNGRITLL